MGVDLAGDEPLQAADDFALRPALGQTPLHVGQRRQMAAQAHDHDAVERGVGLPIATACVDAPCLASMISEISAGSSIGRVSSLTLWPSMTPRAGMRDCQEFRVGAAIVDPKEVPDGTTQSTPYP